MTLLRNWRAYQVPLAAALFGASTFAISVGLVLVNPTEIGWLLYGGDPEVHFFGWHLFRRGPWMNPAGAVPLLQWPAGTSVGLTDSIPLLAFVFKPFSPQLPAHFQYQGFWLLCCFVLQGVFAALLMRTVTPRPELQLLGACLMVMSPPMVNRYNHEALAAHWLVLWALWLYFRNFAQAPFVSWLMVSTVAAATHPYLALMIGALMFAAHARDIILNPSATPRITGRFAAAVGSMALVLWQCGYFVVGAANLKGEKFGLFSMNLLSPVLPLAAYDSAAGPFRPAVRDQYEGYAYLGAGLIMLSLIALFTLRRNLTSMSTAPSDWLRNLPVGIVLVALLLLALGPVISVGPWTLGEYDPKWWGPLTVFRASGRMIWPVYYTVVAGVLAAAIRLSPGKATALLCAAVLLQAWDLSGAYRGLRLMRSATFSSPLQSRFWDVVPQHYRRIVLFPTRMCTAELTFDFRPFALLAGRHGIAINAGTAARADTPKLDDYCRGLEHGVALGTVDVDTLYVLRNDLVSSFRARTRTPTLCVTIDDHGVCVAQETLVKWQDEFDLMVAILPSLEELVTFYEALDSEYRMRLKRPAQPVGASAEERLTMLARYLWYRRGGCTHDEASHKILGAGDREVRICGDPFRPHPLPSVAETFAFRMRLEAMYRDRPAPAAQSSHVDPEGEAVWVQQYVSERLAGQDAAGARSAVLNRIRAVTAAR